MAEQNRLELSEPATKVQIRLQAACIDILYLQVAG